MSVDYHRLRHSFCHSLKPRNEVFGRFNTVLDGQLVEHILSAFCPSILMAVVFDGLLTSSPKYLLICGRRQRQQRILMSYAAGFLSMAGIFKSGGYWQGSMGGFIAALIVRHEINLLPISNLTLCGYFDGDSLASLLSWFLRIRYAECCGY
jgi:hypothetical protein